MKEKIITLGTFRLDEVFSRMKKPTDEDRMQIFTNDRGESFEVDMSAIRYPLYMSQPTCPCCGVTGRFFLLQKLPQEAGYFFNLYGIELNEMVIIQREVIDENAEVNLDNLRTICGVCKTIKGDESELKVPEHILLKARDIYAVKSMQDAMLWVKFWRAAVMGKVDTLMGMWERNLHLDGLGTVKRIETVNKRRQRNMQLTNAGNFTDWQAKMGEMGSIENERRIDNQQQYELLKSQGKLKGQKGTKA